MHKFTIKDFITFNNPCFGCSKPIIFKIGVFNCNDSKVSYFRPVVSDESTEVDLKIGYSNSIKLVIYHKNNKILTNNINDLTTYLIGHKLFLSYYCGDQCGNRAESGFLDFDLKKGHLKPVGMTSETLVVTDKGHCYMLISSFFSNSSRVHIWKKDSQPSSDIKIDLKLLPKFKFKTKEKFLEKMRIYSTFS